MCFCLAAIIRRTPRLSPGPDLWSIFYDELLEIGLPVDVEFIAYADDVAIVVIERIPNLLEVRLEEAMWSITNWMDDNGLKLAVG